MKATIDRDDCIGCGACADTCPEVFRMADGGDVSDNNFDDAKEAEANCPVSVITIE